MLWLYQVKEDQYVCAFPPYSSSDAFELKFEYIPQPNRIDLLIYCHCPGSMPRGRERSTLSAR